MICEYALEPKLVATWHDRKEYLFFDEKFGMKTLRFVSGYPRNWKKCVWSEFNLIPSHEDDNAKKRFEKVIKYLWSNSVRRTGKFNEKDFPHWLEKAKEEHEKYPFRAIIGQQNPDDHPAIIEAKDLINNDENELWKVPENISPKKIAREIVSAVEPILTLSSHVSIVDPYFRPDLRRFTNTLKAMLDTIWCDNRPGIDNPKVELHTSFEKYLDPNLEVGSDEHLKEAKKLYNDLSNEIKKKLASLIPAGKELKVFIWIHKKNGEKLHDRFILTDFFSISLRDSIDEDNKGDLSPTLGMQGLHLVEHSKIWSQYSEESTTFNLAGGKGKVLNIVGKK